MLLLSCFVIRMNIIMKSGKFVTEIIPGFFNFTHSSYIILDQLLTQKHRRAM